MMLKKLEVNFEAVHVPDTTVIIILVIRSWENPLQLPKYVAAFLPLASSFLFPAIHSHLWTET